MVESPEIVAAGVVVLAQGPGGPARAPPPVRRLVLPQGQGRPRRARHHDGGPGGGRGDRPRRPAGAAAAHHSATRCATASPARRSCTTGPAASSAVTTSRRTARTPRSTRSPGSPSARRRGLLTYERDRATLAESRRSASAATRWWCCATARPRPAGAGRATTGTPARRRRPAPGRGGGAAARGVRRDAGRLELSSRRCWTTVAPYADVADLDLEVTATCPRRTPRPRAVGRSRAPSCWGAASRRCCARTGRSCPACYDALGVADPALEPAAMVVVHHRNGQILAVEHARTL